VPKRDLLLQPPVKSKGSMLTKATSSLKKQPKENATCSILPLLTVPMKKESKACFVVN